MNRDGTVIDLPGAPVNRSYPTRVRSSIRAKLMVSHVLVVTLSTLVYSAGGFVLMVVLLGMRGYTVQSFLEQLPAIFTLTIFVLFNIFLITICGLVVASIASWRLARRLTKQVDALALATEDVARGHLDQRVPVLSNDELGRLAERFNLLAIRLQELDAQRRAFVANISHDLRTPLAIIRGHLEAQLRDSPVEERPEDAVAPREAFQAIDHETQTLAKLIDDLFTLSRLEEAALPIEATPVALAELLEDAVRGIRPYALRQSRVSVNVLSPLEIPAVVGDRVRITQIVNNLLHNAVRHTPAGGVVVVEAVVLPGGREVETTVRDTGVGIASQDVPHIFDRFYQGESTRDTSGTGLGLSIVKQLVEGQGGTVSVVSELGEGTAISFRLPVAKGFATPADAT